MTRTSREVIQVFLCFFAVIAAASGLHPEFSQAMKTWRQRDCATSDVNFLPDITCTSHNPPLLLTHPALTNSRRMWSRPQRCHFELEGGSAGAGGEKKHSSHAESNAICNAFGFLSEIIGQNWNDTEKISMAPAQG